MRLDDHFECSPLAYAIGFPPLLQHQGGSLLQGPLGLRQRAALFLAIGHAVGGG